MSKKSIKLPFEILSKNKIVEPWDFHVKNSLSKTHNFSEIINCNSYLSKMPLPIAMKEVAKTIYSLGFEPKLLKQGFEIKQVMGSVGEGLTELLLPGEDVSVNNKGYDVEYCGNYIEVKSTIEVKVSLSNAQYRKADYLLAHKFEKNSGFYASSLLVPLKILKAYKADRTKTVSVSTKTDVWVRNLKITPKRLIAFFQSLEKFKHNLPESQSCAACHNSFVLLTPKSLKNFTLICQDCHWDFWETKYAYYITKYNNKVLKEDGDVKKWSAFNSEWSFSRREGFEITGFIPSQIIITESGFNIHFCPSLYTVTKKRCGDELYDLNFYLVYQNMLSLLKDNDKPIQEFYISYCKNDGLEFFLRTNKAPITPGYTAGKYKLDEFISVPNELRIALDELKRFIKIVTNET